MTCWYCYWGWPKAIADIYDQYIEKAGQSAMHYGPAHVVWDDENFASAEWCLKHFDQYADEQRHTRDALEAVRQSLVELAALPRDLREWPEDYDGGHPERFPPPTGMVMVKR